ncbi:MAG: hypothetical protein WBW88_05275 [Rhodothermales bacterium]
MLLLAFHERGADLDPLQEGPYYLQTRLVFQIEVPVAAQRRPLPTRR